MPRLQLVGIVFVKIKIDDDSVGYFIEPTIIQTTNPEYPTMVEEIFGPVVTIYAYEDDLYEETVSVIFLFLVGLCRQLF